MQKFSRNKPIDEFESMVLELTRVSRMTAGGRRMRFRAVVVTGNKKGKVGIGLAKGADVAQAVEKATKMAKRDLIEVPIYKETIPHQAEAKFGAAEILLKPQAKGRGLVAGGTVRIICNLAGIQNISSKIVGRTTNKLTNAMATIEALKKLKAPSEVVAEKKETAPKKKAEDKKIPE